MGDGGSSRPKASTFQLLFVTWTLFGIAFSFFVARIFVRFKFSSRLFLDDGFALFAILLLLAHAIIITVMLPSMYITIKLERMGSSHKRQAQEMDVFATLTFFLKLQFTQTFLYWTCLWAVKASFLAFFKRLTNNLKGHIIAWWVIVVITALGYTGSVISYPVSCSSFQPLGCSTQRHKTLGLVSLRISTAADILSDLLIIALPMSLALRVRLPWRSRLALCGVFALGGFIVLFSVVRIVVTNTKNTRPELSWLALWSVIEASVACIVCNLAPFKVLFGGRIRATYHSDAYNRHHHQTISKSGYPSHPAIYPPTHPQRSDESSGRSSFQQARRHTRRGLQTHVSAERGLGESTNKIRNGAIIVTREVDRKEIAADQVTLNTEPGEKSDEAMRTMWTDRQSMDSDKIILPPGRNGSGNYGRAY